jgi:hypothetical protein
MTGKEEEPQSHEEHEDGRKLRNPGIKDEADRLNRLGAATVARIPSSIPGFLGVLGAFCGK